MSEAELTIVTLRRVKLSEDESLNTDEKANAHIDRELSKVEALWPEILRLAGLGPQKKETEE